MTALDDLYVQLPQLASTEHQITSPPSGAYNCVAWVERDLERWYEPDFYWPDGVPIPADPDDDMDEYIALFRSLGFQLCDTADAEEGYLKIAIYFDERSFQHVAKQLRTGAWSSKAGRLHDLRHVELDAFHGSGIMGNASATVFMKRPDDVRDSMELEETGLLRRNSPS